MSWTNKDGLIVKFGTEKGTPNPTGSTAENVKRTLEVEVDWEDITAAALHTNFVSPNHPYIPAGSYITSATFIPTEAWTSGGAATLTIGLYQSDGSTAIDADGIDATVAIAALAADKAVACDGALVGGTVAIGSADGYVTFTTGTAAWTAGHGRLVIEYLTDGQ